MSEEPTDGNCGTCCGGHDQDPPRENPVLNAAVKARSHTTLRVAGMDCPDEIAAIERTLKPLAGVAGVKVNLMARTATIAHESSVTRQQLIKAIATAGLKASSMADSQATDDKLDVHSGRARLVSVIVSGVFTGVSLLLQWQNLIAPYGTIAAAVIAMLASGWLILPKAIRALRHFSLDMNVLMSVAVLGAAAIGEWMEAAAVVFLFALSELLEGFSVGRARRAIQSLLALPPSTALVNRDGQIQEMQIEEVNLDEILIIKSGARVPLDGVVTSGESAINQAPITGESMPVPKKPGDTVFAGTINGDGSLEAKVTKASGDTTLAKIIKLVGEAQSQKAPSQRFVDQFAKIYTPVVFMGAIVVVLSGPLLFHGAWLDWTYRALVLLVIACPCALVISTPVSIVSGVTAMARRGVLIKGGVFLEEIGKLKALAVDKTGTITEGRPRVRQVIPWNGKSEEEILRVAAAIDTHSDHPLAQAVVRYAEEMRIGFPRSENYVSRTGRGAEARIDGHLYFVGNHRFTHEAAVCSDDLEKRLAELEAQAMSVVIVGHKPHEDCKGEVLGILAVADTIRANAIGAIKMLHAAGVRRIVMLSGDNQRTVDAIAKQVGIDEAKGDLLPDQKIEQVRELIAQHKHVGMIGDGVNDAPAMAAASIGIAMGGAGTDTAIETADIALMQDDLSKVAEVIALGRRTVRIIQANISFALGVKAIFLALALLGHASLWLAILADTGATLVVIANALRLLKAPVSTSTTSAAL